MTTFIGKAISQLQIERAKAENHVRNLDAAIMVIRRLGHFAATYQPKRSRMSKAARKRIAAAQRKRWAKWRREHGKVA
jgi:hypothetical protein